MGVLRECLERKKHINDRPVAGDIRLKHTSKHVLPGREVSNLGPGNREIGGISEGGHPVPIVWLYSWFLTE